MLPRQYRLSENFAIKEVYQRGRWVKTAHLKLFYFFSKQKDPSFAFVVSKKQVRRIVDRNRLKRIFRAEVSKVLKNVVPGTKVIVQARVDMPKLPSSEIRAELKEALIKAKILFTPLEIPN